MGRIRVDRMELVAIPSHILGVCSLVSCTEPSIRFDYALALMNV